MPTLVLIKVIYHAQNNERKKRIAMSSFLSHLKNHYRSFAYCIVINTLGLGNWSEYCGLVMGAWAESRQKAIITTVTRQAGGRQCIWCLCIKPNSELRAPGSNFS